MLNTSLLITIAAIVTGLWFLFLAFRQHRTAKEAQETWVKTSGVVLDLGLTGHRSQSSKGWSSTKYAQRVSYQYSVVGSSYTGERIGFGSATYAKGKAEKIVAAYPKDGQVTVFYDPNEPSKAVLETKALGVGNYLTLGVIFLAFSMMTLLILPR